MASEPHSGRERRDAQRGQLGDRAGTVDQPRLVATVSWAMVVGWSGDGGPLDPGDAFVWTPGLGIQELRQVLIDQGATIPASLTLSRAWGLSADGTSGTPPSSVRRAHWPPPRPPPRTRASR